MKKDRASLECKIWINCVIANIVLEKKSCLELKKDLIEVNFEFLISLESSLENWNDCSQKRQLSRPFIDLEIKKDRARWIYPTKIIRVFQCKIGTIVLIGNIALGKESCLVAFLFYRCWNEKELGKMNLSNETYQSFV